MSPAARHRLLLRAYPRAYREARGEEILAVLAAAEERRGQWAVVPESGSLLAHGLGLRLRRPLAGRAPAPSGGIAGVGLLLVLAVLGGHQLAAMGLRGLGLDGFPESAHVWVLWVDPRWPIQLASVAAGVSLLSGWYRTTLALAWTAALLHAWLGLAEVATGSGLPWWGDIGPAWDVPFGPGQASWLLLTCLAPTLAGGPARLARAHGSEPAPAWRRVLLAGILASTAALLAAPALRSAAPEGLLGDAGRDAAAVALIACGVALLHSLRRTPPGRQALRVLVVAALVPLATRWATPGTLALALLGAVVFAAGYAIGTHRRAGAGQDRQLRALP